MNEWMHREMLETSTELKTHIVMYSEVGTVSFHLYAWWVTHTICSINVKESWKKMRQGINIIGS